MSEQRFRSWLVLGAACLLLVMLVCPYLPTPTGVVHGLSVKVLIQAMCLTLGMALVAASSLERAVVLVELHHSNAAPDLTDLTCTRLC